MRIVIKASEVRVGDTIRLCLHDPSAFGTDKQWREHIERPRLVKAIVESPDPSTEGWPEFQFKSNNGECRAIDPNSEVILVHRPWPIGEDKIVQMIKEKAMRSGRHAQDFLKGSQNVRGNRNLLVPDLVRLYLAISDYLLGDSNEKSGQTSALDSPPGTRTVDTPTGGKTPLKG